MPVRLGAVASCPAAVSRRRTWRHPWAPPHAPWTRTNAATGSAAAGRLLGLGQPLLTRGQIVPRLLDAARVAGGLGLGQLLLGLADRGAHRGDHRVLRGGARPGGVRGAADPLLDGLHAVLEGAHRAARHVADRVVALLDPAQLVLRVAGRRVDLLRLGEQLLLLLLVGQLLGVARLVLLATGGEEHVLGGPELLPQVVVAVPAGARHGLPAVHEAAHGRRGRAPVGGRRQPLRLGDELLLGGAGLVALRVERGEVRAAAAAERVTGGGEARPQRLVGLAVDAADRLPLLDDRLEPVAGGLPGRRLGGDLLRLRGQRLLAGDLRGAGGGFLGAGLGRGLVGGPHHRPGTGGQAVEVAHRGGGGDRVGQRLRLGLEFARVAGVRLEPRLQQRHLGGQVVVAAGGGGPGPGRGRRPPGGGGARAPPRAPAGRARLLP